MTNSAYDHKISAIRRNAAPDYVFLSYDKPELRVIDLFVIPGHFMTVEVISARKPLRASARRSGWVGSVIHLDQVPQSGRIFMVEGGRIRPPGDVRREFQRTCFLDQMNYRSRGWAADVMSCVERLAGPGSEFSLQDLYRFLPELQRRHPRNRHVKDKIRQQVQVLRDAGYLRFLGRGHYERL